MIHRHLEYPRDVLPEDLPAAAIVDLLDRGDLDDWEALATAVAGDPSGALATSVSHLIDSFPMYGTSPLWRAFLERRRAAFGSGDALADEPHLSELRRSRGVTQTELAARLQISQSDLSKLERRKDWRLSTLRRYVAALGGKLSVRADWRD